MESDSVMPTMADVVANELPVVPPATDPPKESPKDFKPTADAPVSTQPTKKRVEIKNPFGTLAPKVYRLVIWEKPIHSGVALGSCLAFLIYTSYFSLFNTICALAVLAIGVNSAYVFVIKQKQSILNQETVHPHAKYLDNPPMLSAEFIDRYFDVTVDGINYIAQEGAKVVLVEDPLRSMKYVVGFYALWTLGTWLSLRTLLGAAVVLGFAVPIAYQKNKNTVDEKYEQAVGIARTYTDRGLELAKKHTGDLVTKGKDFAAKKLNKSSQPLVEKKNE